MKTVPLFALEMKYRARACAWWSLWAAQGGMRASVWRQPESRLAAAAKARAEQALADAALLEALSNALGPFYPGGIVWP